MVFRFKVELAKYGIPVNDVSNLAAMVNGIRQYGYEVDKVLERFQDLDSLYSTTQVLSRNHPRPRNQNQ
jgi:hypothetical protein